MSRPTIRLAGRRVAAWLIDWLIISGYAAALVPLGFLLVSHSVRLSMWSQNALAFVLLVAPVTVWLAAWESRGATPGKRALGLRVLTRDGARPGWWRALARNVGKVAFVWELGHTAAFLLADSDADAAVATLGITCAIVAYAVAVAFVVSLFIRSGRTPYDRATATHVERRPPLAA